MTEKIGIKKLKCFKCGHEWEVSPGGYWCNCPKCGEPLEIEKVIISEK